MIKYFLLATLCLFLLFLPAKSHAGENLWDRSPNPNGWYGYDESLPDLLNIKGLTYHKARPIIMGAGWKPLQTLHEGTEDYEQGAMSGNGPMFWKKGYHELQTCAGTGAAYCSFLFENKNGDQLRVVTKYEEDEEQGKHPRFAKVAGYRFNP